MSKTKKRGTCSWGHPALTYAEVVKIAENMIPAKLRPFYIGIDVMKQELSEPFTEWNTDIEMLFKAPVVGIVDDARTAHGSLEGIKEDFNNGNVYLDNASIGDPMLAEYDAEHNDRPTVRIATMRKRIRWHKSGK